MKHCQSPGCAHRAAGYSALCAAHAKRKRRHGHVAQRGITRSELRPYVDLTRDYIAAHGGEATWAKLEGVLKAVTSDAAGVVAEARSGRPFHRVEAAAAVELVRVGESAAPRAVIETMAALAVMHHRQPNAFRSDDAVRSQFTRAFRALSSATKRRSYNATEGRVKTHTRDLRQDVALALGRRLQETLGVLGYRISEGEAEERQRRAVVSQEAYAALRPQVPMRQGMACTSA